MSRRCPTRLARLQPDDWRRRLAWSGREFDADTGLYYHRARYLDPTTGRWTTQDPLGFAAGDANLYRYVGNMATLATDPSGYSEQLPLWVRFVNSWDNVLGHHRTGWFAQVSDGAAGMGDTVSMGLTGWVRQGLGYDDWDGLRAGDEVLSLPEDEPQGELAYRRVEEVFQRWGVIWEVVATTEPPT